MTSSPQQLRPDNAFDAQLAAHGRFPLRARGVDTLQVNLGKLCNQACRHCHVDAGPQQTGADVNMGAATVARLKEVLAAAAIRCLDLTGGAPELNPEFRELVRFARRRGIQVTDRCNLSILFEPGQEDLAEFLAEQQVEVVASLPYFRAERTDRQRGAGAFDASIQGLQRLNALGYGRVPELRLHLVYNPVGAYLPGDQRALEAEFKHELRDRHDIEFDQLFCITNMPIARFKDWLERSGNATRYMQALGAAFNPSAADQVMCRDLVSVGPDGRLYDCDFNQMLGLGLEPSAPQNLDAFDVEALAARRIVTAAHCLGCTAGAGSSCGGALAD